MCQVFFEAKSVLIYCHRRTKRKVSFIKTFEIKEEGSISYGRQMFCEISV